MSTALSIFHVFTKKQQEAIDYIADVHMLHRDDIGQGITIYMVNKLVSLGVLEYDDDSDVWDFSNAFFHQMVARGLIHEASGNRTYKTWYEAEQPDPVNSDEKEQPKKEHKPWTPRKVLIIQAAYYMKHHGTVRSDIAIESVVQAWEQNRYNPRCVEYYKKLSHQGLLRLITDVKNYNA